MELFNRRFDLSYRMAVSGVWPYFLVNIATVVSKYRQFPGDVRAVGLAWKSSCNHPQGKIEKGTESASISRSNLKYEDSERSKDW